MIISISSDSKIDLIVGARPNFIKAFPLYDTLKRAKRYNLRLINTGQHYDKNMANIFFHQLKMKKPDINLMVGSGSHAEQTAKIMVETEKVFSDNKPDLVMVFGDVNSTIGTALAASKLHIPVAHVEAGLRSFDRTMPEEINRKIVDHLSDINLVLTEHARRYLIAEGIRPETIIKTGSHMYEVLNYYMPKIETSDVLLREEICEGKFFVVSAHREENVDTQQNIRDLLESLHALSETFQYPIIVSVHPRTRQRLKELGDKLDHPLIRLTKPFGLLDYIKFTI